MLDPAGMLGRVPELGPVAQASPGVAQAMAGGDPHAVWRALRSAASRLPEPLNGEARRLVGRRALFAVPVAEAPPLATVNGFGTRLHGCAEPDAASGTHIATHSVCAAWIPVFPLGQSLLRPSVDGRTRFHGRVPFDRLCAVWRGAWAVLLGAVSFVATWVTVDGWLHRELWVVNGLDVPVAVSFGFDPEEVGPQDRRAFRVGVGAQRYAASVRGLPVESQTLSLSPRTDFVAINVLGAAPLERTRVVYSAGGDDPRPQGELACGNSLIAWDDVDDAFVMPPPALPGAADRQERLVVDLRPGGWRACVAARKAAGDVRGAATIARRAAVLAPERTDGLVLAAELVTAVEGADAAARLLGPVAESRPLDVPLQERFADALIDAGREAEALGRYGALAGARPDDADAAWLLARIEPDPAVAEAGLSRALELLPGHALATLEMGRRRLARRDWAGAVELLSRPLADPSQDAARLDLLSLSLAGGRRDAEALAVLTALGSPVEGREGIRRYVVLARRRPGLALTPTADAALQSARRDDASPFHDPEARVLDIEISLGEAPTRLRLLSVGDDDERACLAGLGELVSDPEAAARAMAALGVGLPRLPPVEWTLLRGEAMRAGDAALQVALDDAAPFTARDAARLRAFIAGEPRDLSSLGPEVAAAARLARSRQPDVGAAARAQLRADAVRGDPLGGLVTVAAERWPG